MYPCTAGVNSADGMQKIACSRPVCTFLKMASNSMYAYVLVRTDLYVDKCHTYWYVLVHTCMYWFILICTSIYHYIQVHTSTYSYILACTGMYSSCADLFWGRHDIVQGSTSSAVRYHEMS